MQRLFAYVRVSTTRQGQGVSLQEQQAVIRDYAAARGFEIICWFEEQQTAAKRGRTKFAEMLRLLRKGAADGVVIHKVDRSARNLRDWADLVDLIDAGVQVYTASEHIDFTSRGGRLMADIEAVIAADFIRNNRDEVKKGLDGRLRQGIWPFAAPIGYLNRGKGQLKAIDPAKAPLVRQTFQVFATRGYTIETILAEMTSRGLRNRNGKPLSADGIWLMLRNPFYIGILRIRRTGASFQGQHPPLISTELFEEVQAVLDGRSYTRLRKHDFLFRRRFMCKTCGRALVGSRQKGHIYYRCHKRACPTTSIREEGFDSAVRDALKAIQFPPELRAALDAGLAYRKGARETRLAAERASTQAALDAVTARLSRLTDAFVDGTVEEQLYLPRKRELLQEQARLRDTLAGYSEDAALRLQKTDEKLQLAGSAIFQYETGSDAERRRLLDRLTCNRTGYGKTVEISLLPPFDRVAGMLTFSKCAHYQDVTATAEAILDLWYPLADPPVVVAAA
jgi:site-specific DNA recombinase